MYMQQCNESGTKNTKDASYNAGTDSHHECLNHAFKRYISLVCTNCPHRADFADSIQNVYDECIIDYNESGNQNNDDSNIKDDPQEIQIEGCISRRAAPVYGFCLPAILSERCIEIIDYTL